MIGGSFLGWLGNLSLPSFFSSSSYPFPAGSQNRDGFERNLDVRMNERGAGFSDQQVMRLSAVWACVRLIAETVSTLPLNVFERMPDGTRRFADEHWLYDLIHNEPNADMTAQTFWESYVAAMLLRGDGFGEKVMNGAGTRVIALNFLLPNRTSYTLAKDGQSYIYRSIGINGVQREIPEELMFHTPGFTTDGRNGMSVVQHGINVFHSALSADAAANSTFVRGMMPTVGFQMERVLTKAQRKEFREDFQKNVAGAMHAGKPFLLEGGMTPHSIGIDPADAQLLESRAWSVEEICRWFRVPPFMVGHSEKSTSWGTGIEQQMIGFLTFALRPWLTRIEQSIRRNLLGAQKNRYFAEFAIEGLLRADSAARAEFYASAGQNGWMTRNEMRSLENLPRIDGGDDLTIQSNLVPIDQLGKTPPAAAAQDALKTWLGILEKETAT